MTRSKINTKPYKNTSSQPTIDDFVRELIARGVQTPLVDLFHFKDTKGTPLRNKMFRNIKAMYHPHHAPMLNPVFSLFTTSELLQKIQLLIEEQKEQQTRGNWGADDRLEIFAIQDSQVRRNARSVALVCYQHDLTVIENGYWQLRVKQYGATYNLCPCEPFYAQPIAAGSICTGVLVAPNIVATAAHFAKESNVRKLRFIFDFEMVDPILTITQMPEDKIYRGVEIIHRQHDALGTHATGNDWALVKLDRPVQGQEIAPLSTQKVFYENHTYSIGFPCGLPKKYAPGLVDRIEKAYFTAHMDIYSGNSGSPLFDAETHQMVGLISRSDPQDFYWADGCWRSIMYPNKIYPSNGAICIKVSEFFNYCQ